MAPPTQQEFDLANEQLDSLKLVLEEVTENISGEAWEIVDEELQKCFPAFKEVDIPTDLRPEAYESISNNIRLADNDTDQTRIKKHLKRAVESIELTKKNLHKHYFPEKKKEDEQKNWFPTADNEQGEMPSETTNFTKQPDSLENPEEGHPEDEAPALPAPTFHSLLFRHLVENGCTGKKQAAAIFEQFKKGTKVLGSKEQTDLGWSDPFAQLVQSKIKSASEINFEIARFFEFAVNTKSESNKPILVLTPQGFNIEHHTPFSNDKGTPSGSNEPLELNEAAKKNYAALETEKNRLETDLSDEKSNVIRLEKQAEKLKNEITKLRSQTNTTAQLKSLLSEKERKLEHTENLLETHKNRYFRILTESQNRVAVVKAAMMRKRAAETVVSLKERIVPHSGFLKLLAIAAFVFGGFCAIFLVALLIDSALSVADSESMVGALAAIGVYIAAGTICITICARALGGVFNRISDHKMLEADRIDAIEKYQRYSTSQDVRFLAELLDQHNEMHRNIL